MLLLPCIWVHIYSLLFVYSCYSSFFLHVLINLGLILAYISSFPWGMILFYMKNHHFSLMQVCCDKLFQVSFIRNVYFFCILEKTCLIQVQKHNIRVWPFISLSTLLLSRCLLVSLIIIRLKAVLWGLVSESCSFTVMCIGVVSVYLSCLWFIAF